MSDEKKKSTGTSRGDRPKKPAARQSWGTDTKFLNVPLGDAQKSAAALWIQGNPPIWEIVDGIVSEGYKLSFGVDKRSGSVMATITDRREGSVYIDHCFTIRGRDWGTALFRLCWVHSIYLDGDWGEIAERPVDTDSW